MTKTKADGKPRTGQKRAAKSSAKPAAKPAKAKAAAKVTSKPAKKGDGAPAAQKKTAATPKTAKTKAAVKAKAKPAANPKKTPVQKKLTQKSAVRKPAAQNAAAKKPTSPKSSTARKTEQSKSLRTATKATATRAVEPAPGAPKRAASAAKAAPAKKATSTTPSEDAAVNAAAAKTTAVKQPAGKDSGSAQPVGKKALQEAEAAIIDGAAASEKTAAPAKSKSKSKSKSGAKASGETTGPTDGPPVIRPKLNVGQKPRIERSESEIAQLVVPAATVARTEELAANAVKASPAAKEAKLAFKVNDHIVYPAHGVGRITGIEKQHIAGITNELFVIAFEQEKMKLRVPTSKAAAVGMRGLSDEAQVNKAVDLLKGRARVKRTMWSRRAQEYEAKINSGDIIAVAEVVRDLYRATDQPEQSYSERQLFEAALDRLAREVSAVRRKDLAATLTDLEASLQQKRAAA